MSDNPVTGRDAANLLAYLREMTRIRALSNEDLCREYLAVAPVFGRLGELGDVLCDRLCPGIVERLADAEPEPNQEQVKRAMDEAEKFGSEVKP